MRSWLLQPIHYGLCETGLLLNSYGIFATRKAPGNNSSPPRHQTCEGRHLRSFRSCPPTTGDIEGAREPTSWALPEFPAHRSLCTIKWVWFNVAKFGVVCCTAEVTETKTTHLVPPLICTIFMSLLSVSK
jgi:hypothetical protein